MGILTVTTTQVQDIQTRLKEDLEAGTFTNYGETPAICIDVNAKFGKNTWINITRTEGDMIQAANGAIIMFEDMCELQIYSKNRTDLNKLYADVLNILIATSRNYTFNRTRDGSVRSRYVKTFNVKLLGG